MAKGRSPNYPSLTLAEAIEKVRKVYTAEHTHEAAKEVIAAALGYSGLNGSSLTMLGALRRYGLLEASGDGLRVSRNAVAVLELPESDDMYRAALHEMAFAPDLFQELRTQFGANLPSEANLRHKLIGYGFLPKAADEVIRVYRENLELVGIPRGEYNSSTAVALLPAAEAGMNNSVSALREPPKSNLPDLPSSSLTHSYALDISIPRNLKAELRIFGKDLKKEDLERLRKQLLRVVENLEDAFSD